MSYDDTLKFRTLHLKSNKSHITVYLYPVLDFKIHPLANGYSGFITIIKVVELSFIDKFHFKNLRKFDGEYLLFGIHEHEQFLTSILNDGFKLI